MNTLSTLFLKNDILDAEMEAYCTSDPEFIRVKEQFYQTAHEIEELIGFDMYDTFERNFAAYMYRTADLYYLFGLGLRQDILQSLAADESYPALPL